MARNDRRVSTDVFWISAFAGMTCPPVNTDHSMVCLALPVSLRIVQRGVQGAEGPLRCFPPPQDWGTKGLTLKSLDWIPAFAGMTCPPVDTDHSMACLALPVFLRVVQRGVQRAEGPLCCLLFPQDWGIKGVDTAESSGGGVPTPGCASLPLQPRMTIGGPIYPG